ncbi:monovalent cation/H(+) antiporter subunit G [Lentisphaera profundi]|uniref:Monovalent cation/H(+) antiporter subunit G n=1 Tax=Lentisphaera profundi TaxID=1658616 RepID=A0ABY7VRP5_9BACT|nr:monovalent cation/H(+) antiporter subunit G [Lentisphaera profundi]WDE95454.1 monovalent cation/H(+) antiporter subunit G [Lentisphaera profundi]
MSLLLSIILIIGAAFTTIAAIGLIRFPDFYTRMHAATKAGAFGGIIILLLCAFYFASLKVAIIVFVNIIFFYFTAPVAAHMIARSAYINRVKQWKGSKADELKGNITLKHHHDD